MLINLEQSSVVMKSMLFCLKRFKGPLFAMPHLLVPMVRDADSLSVFTNIWPLKMGAQDV